jgi:hypothetical protein
VFTCLYFAQGSTEFGWNSTMKLAKGLYKTAKAGVIGSTDIEIMVCFPDLPLSAFRSHGTFLCLCYSEM